MHTKIHNKKELLIERTARALAVEPETAAALLRIGRIQSFRVNPLKADTKAVMSALAPLGWEGKVYDWYPQGYSIDSDITAIRDSSLFANGQIYIQNAASWLPVLALDAQPDDEILDVCAAPGGKTSHIAVQTNNRARITANDNSRPRLAKLRANLERLGVQGVDYTLYEASQLSYKLKDRQFDKILLDAPCSGEGMMAFDNDKDFQYWSVAQIKRLQQLQKKIMGQAWRLLKPGGTLVYSTCTMAPEENEAVIDYLLRHNDDAHIVALDNLKEQLPNVGRPVLEWNNKRYSPDIKDVLRLHPSPQIEACFVCKLTKSA